jgi:hypothetical protein
MCSKSRSPGKPDGAEIIWDVSAAGLEVNAKKTKYMLLPHHQNAGKNNDVKIANKCF